MSKTKTRSKMMKTYKELYEDIPKGKEDIINYIIDTYNLSQKNIENVEGKIEEIKKRKKNKISYTLFEIPLTTDRARGNWKTRTFYVNNAKKNKEFLIKYLKENHIDNLITNEIHMNIVFYFPIPKSMTKEDRLQAELGYLRPIVKPDLDNIYKTYTDMMNEVLILDDSLISEARIIKKYSMKPRIDIEINYYTEYDSKYNKRKIESSLGYRRLKKERDDIKCLRIRF